MIKLYDAKNKQFYFTICGKNGQVVLTSETYTRKADAMRAIKNVRVMMLKGSVPFIDFTGK